MTRSILFLAALLLLVATAGHAAPDDDELPEVTEEGLHRVHDARLAIVYADPEADLSIYDSVRILEPLVAFKKNWKTRQMSTLPASQRVRNSDMERIKATLAREFVEVFTEVLQEGEYTVTDQVGDTVMLIRPAIIDLDPTAPEVRSTSGSRNFVRSAGEMTLYIELYDAPTSALIAKALDRRIDGAMDNHFMWANPSSNSAAARAILRRWAEVLRDALDEART